MTETKEEIIPKTIKELRNWMKRECLNEHSYSIGGKPAPFEGFVLNPKDNILEWYYTERGIINVLKTFTDEEEACRYAFEQMNKDMSARLHLAGFFKDENLQKEFCKELENREIKFRTDRIPYDIDSPRFRVFVYGCDYKKIAALKKKYESGQNRLR